MALNNDQINAVDCTGHCLVVACPGAGKTSTLVAKIISILQQNPEHKVCAVTFTKDSAIELRSRILKSDDSVGKRVIASTFHSLALKQLQAAGVPAKPASPLEQFKFVLRAMEGAEGDLDFETAQKMIESVKCSMAFVRGEHVSNPVFENYQALLARYKVVDFQDMLSLTLRGMWDGTIDCIPYTHILVDEFQDTDEIQYAWVYEHIKQRNVVVTVVGDDDQTIYTFRRAMGYAGMMRFQQETNAKLITLVTNYRSRHEIVDHGTRLIQNNPDRVPKQVGAARGKGGSVNVIEHPSREVEAENIVAQLMSFVVPMNETKLPYRYTCQSGKLAILARSGRHLDRMEKVLNEQKIRYYRNTKSIWDQTIPALYLSLLGSLETGHPIGFDLALHFAGLSNADIEQLHQLYGNKFANRMVYKETETPPSFDSASKAIFKSAISKFSVWRGHFRNHKLERADGVIGGVCTWIRDILKGQADYREPDFGTNKKGSRSYYEYVLIESAMKQFQRDFNGSITDRINKLRQIGKSDPDEKDRGVGLYTMHGSKGLEFDHVWIIAAEQDSVPGNAISKALEELPDDPNAAASVLSDERRLFYVAMTRAKNELTISHISGQASQFVKEAGLEIKLK